MMERIKRRLSRINYVIIVLFFLGGCIRKNTIINDHFGELILNLFITHYDLKSINGSIVIHQSTWTDSTLLISISFHENEFPNGQEALNTKYRGFNIWMNKKFNSSYFKGMGWKEIRIPAHNKEENEDIVPPSEYLNIQFEVSATSNCIIEILLISSNKDEKKERIYFLKYLNYYGLMCDNRAMYQKSW